MTNLDREHPITGEMDDMFWCAQSRHSGVPDDVVELQRDKGNINPLAYSKRRDILYSKARTSVFWYILDTLNTNPGGWWKNTSVTRGRQKRRYGTQEFGPEQPRQYLAGPSQRVFLTVDQIYS